MVLFRRSLAIVLMLVGCSSTDEAGTQSPCATRLYQFSDAATLDESNSASVVACVDDQGLVRPFNRVDALGGNLCPSASGFGASPACRTNSDCPQGNVCLCPLGVSDGTLHSLGPNEPACIPAECTSGNDCHGSSCGLSADEHGIPAGLYCRGPSDDCTSDDDCEPGGMCNYVDGRWACQGLVVPEG